MSDELFAVEVNISFKANVIVKAKNKAEARKRVQDDFRLSLAQGMAECAVQYDEHDDSSPINLVEFSEVKAPVGKAEPHDPYARTKYGVYN